MLLGKEGSSENGASETAGFMGVLFSKHSGDSGLRYTTQQTAGNVHTLEFQQR